MAYQSDEYLNFEAPFLPFATSTPPDLISPGSAMPRRARRSQYQHPEGYSSMQEGHYGESGQAVPRRLAFSPPTPTEIVSPGSMPRYRGRSRRSRYPVEYGSYPGEEFGPDIDAFYLGEEDSSLGILPQLLDEEDEATFLSQGHSAVGIVGKKRVRFDLKGTKYDPNPIVEMVVSENPRPSPSGEHVNYGLKMTFHKSRIPLITGGPRISSQRPQAPSRPPMKQAMPPRPTKASQYRDKAIAGQARQAAEQHARQNYLPPVRSAGRGSKSRRQRIATPSPGPPGAAYADERGPSYMNRPGQYPRPGSRYQPKYDVGNKPKSRIPISQNITEWFQ